MPAKQETAANVVTVNGKTFDVESLTLDEVEAIEEALDTTLDEADWRRARVMKHILFTFLRRDDPDLELADVGKLTYLDLSQNGNGDGAA